MKNESYFPMEINMINKEHVWDLIEKQGPKGFGAYVMMLTELRKNPHLRCKLSAIKGMARKCKISNALISSVVNDFRLFELTKEDKDVIISSPYLDRVMAKDNGRKETLVSGRLKGYYKVARDSSGKFTAGSGTAYSSSRSNTIKTTTTATPTVDTGAGSWEEYLDQAMNDEIWVELLAKNSGFGRLFMEYRSVVVDAFRQHVQLQGSGQDVHSVKDIKAYFANFLRPGTPTQKRVAALLSCREDERQQTLPNRYETIDPATGQRSYFGNIIPPDAPPRPNDNAVWSENLTQWI